MGLVRHGGAPARHVLPRLLVQRAKGLQGVANGKVGQRDSLSGKEGLVKKLLVEALQGRPKVGVVLGARLQVEVFSYNVSINFKIGSYSKLSILPSL